MTAIKHIEVKLPEHSADCDNEIKVCFSTWPDPDRTETSKFVTPIAAPERGHCRK